MSTESESKHAECDAWRTADNRYVEDESEISIDNTVKYQFSDEFMNQLKKQLMDTWFRDMCDFKDPKFEENTMSGKIESYENGWLKFESDDLPFPVIGPKEKMNKFIEWFENASKEEIKEYGKQTVNSYEEELNKAGYEVSYTKNKSDPDKPNQVTIKDNDIVSHPNHYCEGRKYEPKDVIYDWGLDFNLGSAVKYLARAGRKEHNSKEQDLEKAIQYIEFELEEIKKEKNDD